MTNTWATKSPEAKARWLGKLKERYHADPDYRAEMIANAKFSRWKRRQRQEEGNTNEIR